MKRGTPQKLFIDLEAGVRECGSCHELLPLDDFPNNSAGPGGKQSYCRVCYRAYQNAHRTPEHRRHGLTEDEFESLWSVQQGCCKICGRELERGHGVNIDHDHSHCPGKYGCAPCVRGLLCPQCNMRLGTIENQRWMMMARTYLAGYDTGSVI